MIELLSAVTGANSAVQLARSILDMKVDRDVKEKTQELMDKLIDLQSKVIAGHADYAAIASIKSDLEAKIADMEKWDSEAQRYELCEFAEGTLAYKIKESENSGEPTHYICPQCYQDSIKSILQKYEHAFAYRLKCHRCNLDIFMEMMPDEPQAGQFK